MTLSTYAHVFDELEGQERVPGAEMVRRARADVPVLYLAEGLVPSLGPETPDETEALCRTRTGDPFLTMEVLYQLS